MRATRILEYRVFGYCAKLVTCSVDPLAHDGRVLEALVAVGDLALAAALGRT